MTPHPGLTSSELGHGKMRVLEREGIAGLIAFGQLEDASTLSSLHFMQPESGQA